MPQHVDIFIPASPQIATPRLLKTAPSERSAPVPTVNSDVVPPVPKKPPLDHLRPRYPRPAALMNPVPVRRVAPPAPAPAPQPIRTNAEPKAARPSPKVRHRRGRKFMMLAAMGCAMLAGGMALQAAVYGELLIAAYAVYALVRRVESRTTFSLALISLGCILVMLLVRPNADLMQNFAIYAFLLLLVGTVSLTVETRY